MFIRFLYSLTKTTVIVLIAWTLSTPTYAQGTCPDVSDATSAKLILDERQVKRAASLISKWRSDEEYRLVKFNSYISKKGRFEGATGMSATFRMSDNAAQQIARRLDQLNYEPATIGGEPVRVYVPFTILARKTDSGVNSQLFMNHLHSANELGMSYTAPQRLYSGSMTDGQGLGGSTQVVNIQTTVSAKGVPADAMVLATEHESTGVDSLYASRIEASCFIPGSVDGVPTAMKYVESFGNF